MNSPWRIMLVSALLWVCCSSAVAQKPGFTYQGKLTDGGTPANGRYDFRFSVFDQNGTQLVTDVPFDNVLVTDGIFSVLLPIDISLSPGIDRLLQIQVRPAGSGSFTVLQPRQPITFTPYAMHSLDARAADSVAVSGIPAGSGNYIQNNPASQQVSSNFNISGNGTAGGTLSGNAVNATNEFRLNGSRILSRNQFTESLFVGLSAGFNAPGNYNTYVGTNAGRNDGNQGGNWNTTLGYTAIIAGGANNATAIGAHAFVSQNNSLVLGSIAGQNTCSGEFGCDSVNVGIGTPAPAYRLDVVGRIRLKQNTGNTANVNTAGLWLFQNTPNVERAFIGMMDDTYVGLFGNNGANWGLVMNTQNGNVGIGNAVPQAKLHVAGTGFFTGNVGINTPSPDQLLTVNGGASKPGGGSWAIFSDERLKNIKGSFTPGLKAVMQLRPIRYKYKPQNALEIKSTDEYIGFSAQAVQKIIPEAVIRNDKGYLLINNDPIIWTMLNAIKEQQAQLERQQREIDALKKVVRSRKTNRAISRAN